MKSNVSIISALAFISTLLNAPGAKAQNVDMVDSHPRASRTNLYKKYLQEKIYIHSGADQYTNGQVLDF